ncbi:MAG TPA: hypothetical protein VGY57_13795 [Vicinamibacterales bacterium]|nr:hypothetical protein [Vicinamibacterales bacterium]
MLFAIGLCGAAGARAQTTAKAPSRLFVAFDVGPTFGHSSDVFVGGEAGLHWKDTIDFFLEGGHIGNVATADFDTRASTIANFVGADVSSVQKVNFADIGIRYHSPVFEKWDGYVGLAGGAAQVKNETVLSVNGSAVAPESLGVAFGADLNGSVRVGIVTLAVGATRDFDRKYFADVSVRYGRTFSKSDADGNVIVPGLNTLRLQVGVGVRF